jgi:hypothetical protein
MSPTKILAVFGALFVFLVVHGCAGMGGGIKPNPDNPIRTVAVLPMVNNTNDVEAPDKVREMFHEKLQAYYYNVKPLKETDEILNLQMGITLGKQLELTTAQQLGEKLGVDGVFYGYLLNFDETVTGAYDLNKVRMGWKLVNTKTGEISWGRGIAVKSESGSGMVGAVASVAMDVTDSMDDDIGKMPSSADPKREMPGLDNWVTMESSSSSSSLMGSLMSSVGSKVADSVMGSRLEEETNYALGKLFPQMLVGPGG